MSNVSDGRLKKSIQRKRRENARTKRRKAVPHEIDLSLGRAEEAVLYVLARALQRYHGDLSTAHVALRTGHHPGHVRTVCKRLHERGLIHRYKRIPFGSLTAPFEMAHRLEPAGRMALFHAERMRRPKQSTPTPRAPSRR